MKSCIITIDGVNFSRRFIAKEVTIHLLDENTTRHMILQAPSDFWLTPADKKTQDFAVNILGGAAINDHNEGSLSYYSHVGAISSLTDYRIYVVGEITHRFVRNILPHANLWNIQDLTPFKFPKELRSACCGIPHSPRYCSLAKMWFIRDFILETPPSTWNERPY